MFFVVLIIGDILITCLVCHHVTNEIADGVICETPFAQLGQTKEVNSNVV
jgi:hypothetical protein